jgi:predicted acylesterase/phospholipase RssA
MPSDALGTSAEFRGLLRDSEPGFRTDIRPVEDRLDDVPIDELRFAVVLNGGVSLAVWMGGAVYELDRLTRSEGDDTAITPYSALLAFTRSTVRADVMAGSSAGGINGAALALTARPTTPPT